MQKRAAQTDVGPVKVGAMVQMAVDDLDRGKVDDDSNASLVERVQTDDTRREIKFWLAGPTGVVNNTLLAQLQTSFQASQVVQVRPRRRLWWAWS